MNPSRLWITQSLKIDSEQHALSTNVNILSEVRPSLTRVLLINVTFGWIFTKADLTNHLIVLQMFFFRSRNQTGMYLTR